MIEASYFIPPDRGVIAVGGADARPFLQGLVSNDVDRVAPDRAVYSAFLTPQGKFLHDFFMVEMNGVLMLDCEGGRVEDLLRRLSIYKLRSDVDLDDAGGELAVALMYGDGAAATAGLAPDPGAATSFAGGVAYVDPRLAEAGARALLPRQGAAEALEGAGYDPGDAQEFDGLRMGLGLPDGSRDMMVEKAIILENGFEELNGVSFEKGCYVGQEVTARAKHRGLVKKRLVPLAIDGPTPAPGTPILAGDKEAGEMRSGGAGMGLALMRLQYLEPGTDLAAGEARLTPRKPAWAEF